MASATPWVRTGPEANQAHCQRCGQVWSFGHLLPLDIPKLCEVVEGFTAAHKYCPEPKKEPL